MKSQLRLGSSLNRSKTGKRPRANGDPWVLIAAAFHCSGGMEKANSALAEYLVTRNTPLHLVAHDVHERFLENPAITVHLVTKPAGSLLLGEWPLHLRGRMVARHVLGRWPHTRVLVNGGNCVWPDINWVHSVHHAWPCVDDGSPLWFRIKNHAAKRWARWRERISICSARVVLANSERTRGQILAFFRTNPEMVHTVYLGADPDWGPPTLQERELARAWLGKPKKRPLAVFVGALSHDRNKGLDLLLSAWRVLCSNPDWDVDLVVAGGGNGLKRWKSTVASSCLVHRVLFLGFTERVRDLLAAVDLLVSPVRYEGYGLNAQEAICRGVPVMISRSAGIAERYTPQVSSMLLPDPDNVDDLVQRLLGWRSSLSLWNDRFRDFANVLRGHTWTDMARQIVAIVERGGKS